MRLLLVNVALAFLWASTIGPFTLANLIVGFVVGHVTIWLGVSRTRGSSNSTRVWGYISLGFYFLWELWLANLSMVRYTFSPLRILKPAILKIPIREGMTDLEITSLANMITLTPGTLTLDVSEDRRALFVHFMHVDDPKAAVESITDGFQRRILETTR